MSSDVVWIALIGSSATVVVGIGAAIIQMRSTRMQLDSRREEVRLQIQTQSEENLRSRLGELRKAYLVPLSEKLSEWLADSRIATGAIAAAQLSLANGLQIPLTVTNSMREALEAAVRTAGALNALQDRNSDPQLYSLVQNALSRNTTVANAMISLMSSPQPNTEALLKGMAEFKQAHDLLQQSLMATNRRIEELVAGYPTSNSNPR